MWQFCGKLVNRLPLCFRYPNRIFQSNGKHLKTVLDSGFNAVDSRFQVLDSGFFVSGTWILDSKLDWDSGFLGLYCGFQSPGFRIPQQKSAGIWIPRARQCYPSAYYWHKIDLGNGNKFAKKGYLIRDFIGLGYVHTTIYSSSETQRQSPGFPKMHYTRFATLEMRKKGDRVKLLKDFWDLLPGTGDKN